MVAGGTDGVVAAAADGVAAADVVDADTDEDYHTKTFSMRHCSWQP